MMDDLDLTWPAIGQLRKIKDFKRWACRPYPKDDRPQIPLFYTHALGQAYPWTKPLRVLEALTQGPVWQIFLFWIPLWSWITFQTWPMLEVGTSIAGFLSWTFIEYWTHRGLFHNSFLFDYLPEAVFTMHFVHHKQPQDTWRLTMPLIMSLPLGTMILSTVFIITNYHWYHTLSWAIGFGLGYILYDIAHFLSHFAPVVTLLQKHHLLHHGLCHRKYGFTTSLWDRIFCTE